jgi:DNA-binding NarL/FixJ family response regulator
MSLEDARAPCPTLLVEDHPLMRETLSEFLRELSAIELIGMVATAEEALSFCEEQRPELALIDVSLPGMNGIDLVSELHARYPGMRCLMLSGHREVSYVERALANGASGYVLKGDPSELLRAVDAVARGETYLSDTVRSGIDARPRDG